MSTDNRTPLNDCDANTGWAGDDTANAIATTGSFIEGAGALSTQLSNADEHMYTTQDSVGAGTFNLDFSDSTLYMNIKDNLFGAYSTGGVQFVIGDGTDRTGYDVGGNDAVGMPGQFFFHAYKMDVSEVITTPGGFTDFAGTEANLTHTAITQIGYGSLHLAKAVGSVDNVIMDGFYYIANDSYALTINGGTVGTPEEMADVVGDDETNGWNLVTNPLGKQYVFFGPTEWGTPSGTANSYFTSDGEQWFWVGDNAGGRPIAATHFPFRIIGNGTGTNSWVVSNTVIVNTGTRGEFDISDTNMDTIEMDGCQLTDLGAISLPSSGGTSRFTTNNIFSACDQITNNGADMTGSSVLVSNVAAGSGALLYNEASDPDGELDNMTFSQGATAHSAIEFGTNVDSSLVDITIRGCDFTGFGSTDDVNGAVFKFLATTGSLNLNLIGCTADGTFSVDDSAGITVTVIVDPVTVSLAGTTEGTSCKIIANETVGTITQGDVLGEGFSDSDGIFSFSFDYETAFNPTGLDVLSRARNQGLAVAAIAEDGGVFTDETAEAASVTASDMTLLPAVPALNDAYYLGHTEQFPAFKLNITTPLTQSSAPTFALEYWNGAWTVPTGISDGTQGLENIGENIVSFTLPGDWVTTTINSQGPFYYVRIRLAVVGTITQVPIGETATIDATRYLPYSENRVITSTGLSDIASWQEDTISKFTQD